MKKQRWGKVCFFIVNPGLLRWGILGFAALVLWACGMNMVPSKDSWYMQHYIIMQDFERDVYKDLTPEAKLQLQDLFWGARAAESKQVFLERMEFINNQFKRENFSQPWNTDRSRIYLLNGRPASVEYEQNANWAISARETSTGGGSVSANDRSGEDIQANTAEVWTYPFHEQFIKYGFVFSPPKTWKLGQGGFSGNRFLGEFEIQSRMETYAILDVEGYKGKLEKLR